jgi:FkbM family methyltransferase
MAIDKLVRKAKGMWRMVTKPTLTRLNGITLMSDPRRIGTDMARWIWFEKYEAQESAIVAEIVEPGDRVLDCGGGLGYVAALAAKRAGPTGAVRVIEANPALIEMIEDHAAMNGVTVEVVQAAIGKTEGEAVFHIDRQFVASSMTPAPGREAITVRTRAFAEEIRSFAPTVIIMDIEGAEAELFDDVDLCGVRALCIELHPRAVGRVESCRPIARAIDAGLAIDFDRTRKDVFFLSRPR